MVEQFDTKIYCSTNINKRKNKDENIQNLKITA